DYHCMIWHNNGYVLF
nr:immunoglobulin light chain junction region [Macaca mulatta]